MIELAPSILKRCLLPQTIAGTAGDRPHGPPSFFGLRIPISTKKAAQIRSAIHVLLVYFVSVQLQKLVEIGTRHVGDIFENSEIPEVWLPETFLKTVFY